MNKNGFTLVELILVLVIMTLVGTGSIIAYDNINDDTALVERENLYKEIQRAAVLYVELNDIYKDSDNFVYYHQIGDLRLKNYVGKELIDPLTKEEIQSHYFSKVYISKDRYGKDYVDSCIIEYSGDDSVKSKCIADSEGKESDYCCASCVIKEEILAKEGEIDKYIKTDGDVKPEACVIE